MDSLIDISKELIKNFTDKSWQEIENLKLKLDNLSKDTYVEKAVYTALNDLLTSYYIFVGRLESLTDDRPVNNIEAEDQSVNSDYHTDVPKVTDQNTKNTFINDMPKVQISDNTDVEFEPFEYFVDFDEPVGNPLSDKDLYGK